MFFGGGERANARTPSQTLRVARGPSDVGPFAVGVSGDGAANGQHTVSVGGWGADDWPNQRQG
jgi:hypothetical protein